MSPVFSSPKQPQRLGYSGVLPDDMTYQQTLDTIADAFVDGLKTRPLDFETGNHIIVDKKSGVRLWVANGRGSYGYWDGDKPHRFSYFWKQWKVSLAIKRWRKTLSAIDNKKKSLTIQNGLMDLLHHNHPPKDNP